MMYLDEVKARLVELNIVKLEELVPCTVQEVSELEQRLGLALPEAYREFLLWMGHGGGEILGGSNCFYRDLPKLGEWAVNLLAENDYPEPLPDDAFVFCMHQGYQFSFLKLSEGDDPPVYYYNEADHQTSFSRESPKFSDYLREVIESHAGIL